MTLDEYQERAVMTLQGSSGSQESIEISLLGLAGETGELLTLYKKLLRDGPAYEPIQIRLNEELGDILWYLAAIGSHFNLKLSDVAERNIMKTEARWLPADPQTYVLYDEDRPDSEQLPRSFVADLHTSGSPHRQTLELFVDGEKCGSTLTDNAYASDDYRYHDLLHLAFAAVLGWSPVMRALLRRKRKSDPLVDEVEDGGRAVAIEEGLAALIFNYSKEHSFLLDVSRLDWRLLKTCYAMTAHLEVASRSLHDWERAILLAFRAWRTLQSGNGEGKVRCDLLLREIEVVAKT